MPLSDANTELKRKLLKESEERRDRREGEALK